MKPFFFLAIMMALLALAHNASSSTTQTVRGKVTRITATAIDVQAGDRVVHLSKDPFSSAGKTKVKLGDEVIVTYNLEVSEHREVKQIQRVKDRQEAGQVPGAEKPEQKPEAPVGQPDDRIFYDS